MSRILRGLAVSVTAVALWLPTIPLLAQSSSDLVITPRRRALATPTTPTQANFTPSQVEYYLGDEGIAYIRPGVQVKINSITIPSDRKPVIDLTITDDYGQPLDRSGAITPGTISASFILAFWDGGTRHYTAYTTRIATAGAGTPFAGQKAVQAGTDSGGKWTNLDAGHYSYKFGTALPANFDQSRTHTLGIYATRNVTDIIGKNYYDNVEYDFRPDGAPLVAKWDKINQATSCMNCHDETSFAFHGGSRREVRLCVLCHQPQTTDPDTMNTVDFKVMIHKIHRGENLPSVEDGTPYQIIGFNQSVHDYSDIAFPQDIRNCTNCHVGTDPSKRPSQFFVWNTFPTREACGSCHDDIDWKTGAHHPGGSQMNSASCVNCHMPDGGLEFGPAIKDAHTIPVKSKQLAGLNVAIVSVSNVAAGSSPTVVYKITENNGKPVDGNTLSTFSPILAGPNSNYAIYYRENAVGKGVYDAANGTTAYTFTNPIPADATGSWTIAGDFYRNVSLVRADGQPDVSVREAAFNPIQYVAVTDSVAKPRRMVVDINNCNRCHDRLALHGGQRLTTRECVICHNPTNTDEEVRPADEHPSESISFQHLIHRIHSGHELQNDFTVYGFRGSVHNFNEVHFPADRRNCVKCHVGNTWQLPVPQDAALVTTPRDLFSPQGPGTAACLGCHDSRDASAHAYLNTTTFGDTASPAEACNTCHGMNKFLAVAKVHAR